MSPIDLLILAILGISTVVSLFRGFIREVLSLVVWAVALGMGWWFFRPAGQLLSPWIQHESLRLGIGFGAVFLGVLALGGLLTYLIGTLVDKTGLSGTDRLLGMVFGALRGGLLVCLLVFLAGLTPMPDAPWWKESLLVQPFQDVAYWLLNQLPPEVAGRFRPR